MRRSRNKTRGQLGSDMMRRSLLSRYQTLLRIGANYFLISLKNTQGVAYPNETELSHTQQAVVRQRGVGLTASYAPEQVQRQADVRANFDAAEESEDEGVSGFIMSTTPC
jgi:hypothetical protein